MPKIMKAWKSQLFKEMRWQKKGAVSNEPELNDAKTNEAPRALADSLI